MEVVPTIESKFKLKMRFPNNRPDEYLKPDDKLLEPLENPHTKMMGFDPASMNGTSFSLTEEHHLEGLSVGKIGWIPTSPWNKKLDGKLIFMETSWIPAHHLTVFLPKFYLEAVKRGGTWEHKLEAESEGLLKDMRLWDVHIPSKSPNTPEKRFLHFETEAGVKKIKEDYEGKFEEVQIFAQVEKTP